MLYIILLLPLALGFLPLICKSRTRGHTACMLAGQGAETALVIYAIAAGSRWASPPLHLTESLSFSLELDGVGAVFCTLIAISWLLTLLYASVYMSHQAHQPRFYFFLFATESAMLGTALAGDFITFYLFFELTTLLSMPLVLHELTRASLLGASKYLYYSIGGAFLALGGLAVLYGSCSSLTFAAGGTLLSGQLTPLVLGAALCVILGFGAKAGLYPLHNWLPSAHPVAPAPASALLSGVIAKAGVLAVIRLVYGIVGADNLRGTWVQMTCLILALVTVFMGSFMGCLEKGLKKRLAYSSISQISYILLGVFILSDGGLLGALLQLVFHASAKIAIFLCAGVIIHLTGAVRVDQLRGLGRRIPVTFVCFTLVSLSLVGIPPFGGFLSKWYLATAALDSLPGALAYIAPTVLIVSALLTAGYLFPPAIAAFFPGKDTEGLDLSPIREPRAMVAPLLVFSAICGLMGFFPHVITGVMQRIAAGLL